MRYRMAQIGHLCRTPLGRRQLSVHLYSRAWPIFNVLAIIYRRTLTRRTRVVAVVGSYGKTTTSTAISHTLGLKRINLPGKGVSQVALSILRTLPGQHHGVVEVAVNRLGQMKSHARALCPDVVIITSIGSEHHRSLGDIDAIRHEKAIILRGLATGGVVIYNGDDPQVGQMDFPVGSRHIRFGFDAASDVRASGVSIDWPHGTCFTLHLNQEIHRVRTRFLGRKMVYPILAVLAVAQAEGYSIAETIAAVETIPPVDGRMQLIPLSGDIYLLRDEHKSSLETIDAALDVLSEIPARRLVVFGDISEPPGSQGPIYRRLGGRIAAMASYAIFVGEHFRQYARGARRAGLPSAALFNAGKNLDAAVDALRRQLHPGDVVLIKGRNTQRMERISLALMGQTVNCKIEFCNAMGTRCYRCPMLERGWKPNEVWPVGK